MKIFSLIALAVIAAVPQLKAQYTEVDISPDVNADIQQYTLGGNYQLGGTQLNAGGVPFALAELGGNPFTTGVIQSPSSAGGFPSGNVGPFDYTFSLPAGTQATALYSLANTAFGSYGTLVGSLIVTGTLGETATLNLVEGVNIRDHNNDGFVNTLSDATVLTTDFLGGAPTVLSDQTRLDRQELLLGAAFAGDTIATIDFSGFAQGGDGAAFLAGLTLANANVPDSSLPLPLTAGLLVAVLAWAGARRRQVSIPA
jgi:hypothetical protein